MQGICHLFCGPYYNLGIYLSNRVVVPPTREICIQHIHLASKHSVWLIGIQRQKTV